MDQQPITPAPAVTVPTDETAKSNRKRTILALWLMIGPTALIVVSIIAYAVVNFITSQTTTPQTDALFSEPSVGSTAANVILFIVGAISVMTWLPGMIAGIILLATKKK